jgi:hypothetical protein
MGDREDPHDLTTSGSPELDLVARFALGERGHAVVEYLDHKRRQRAKRGKWFLDAADATGDQLLAASTSDERIEELLEHAVEAAAASSDRSKVEALGRVFRRCLNAGDDAQLDEAQLFLDTVSRLERPHARLLAHMVEGEEAQPTVDAFGETKMVSWWAQDQEELVERTGFRPSVLTGLIVQLVTAGLATEVPPTGIRRHKWRAWALTDFGRDIAWVLAGHPGERPQELSEDQLLIRGKHLPPWARDSADHGET